MRGRITATRLGPAGITTAASNSLPVTIVTPQGPNKGAAFLDFTGTLPRQPGLYEIQITATPTGWIERFLLQIPSATQFSEVPVVVAFHKFSNSPYDIIVNTRLAHEAEARGWFLVAPLGAADMTFSSIESQINTEIVLELVTDFYRVDENRIYGVGFSMGGGNVLNYAARHVDPNETMFAAVVNHTGGPSQAHTYYSDPGSQFVFDFWLGGNPASFPFLFSRSSVIDLDPNDDVTVDPTTDLARNLTHVPIQTWYGDQDPLAYLVTQCLAFDSHLNSLGGNSTVMSVPTMMHEWDTLDYTVALDWLAQQTLTLPTAADTLIDSDGRYFHFDVTQDLSGQFSSISWFVDAMNNQVTITNTSNIATIVIDTMSSGLTSSSSISLLTSTADGTGDVVVFTAVANLPVSVTRDSVPNSSWTYDSLTETLSINELDGSTQHAWNIDF